MTLLEVKNLKKSYSSKTILHSLSFTVKKGEVVGLLGPNGAGKTTAFYLSIGLIRPDAGQVLFNGFDITDKPIHERAKMGMGYLAQEPSIFRNLSVEDNILCILEMMEKDPKKRKQRLGELLEELRLKTLAKKKACTLSGGERRRLEITRALVTNPSLLLLDEPFANIDPITIADVKKMIKLLKAKGISVLITDHNAREIFSIVDTSYLIQDGKVTLSGSVKDLVENQIAKQTYLGEDFTL